VANIQRVQKTTHNAVWYKCQTWTHTIETVHFILFAKFHYKKYLTTESPIIGDTDDIRSSFTCCSHSDMTNPKTVFTTNSETGDITRQHLTERRLSLCRCFAVLRNIWFRFCWIVSAHSYCSFVPQEFQQRKQCIGLPLEQVWYRATATTFREFLDWLIEWGLTALSAQICYVVSIKSIL